MKTPPQKIIVIYHGDCPDGFGGAYAAWKNFKNKAAYIPARDRFALPCPLKNKEVYLIDYTYEKDVVAKLIKNNKKVTAIDHHISSEAVVKMTHDYSFALDHSGAVLAWHYFHPSKKVPQFLRYIEDRDLWKWKMPNSKDILMTSDLEDKDFKVWDKIVKDLESTAKRKLYKEEGVLLQRYEKKIIGEILKDVELVRFLGHKVWAVNAPGHFTSDLGGFLAKQSGTFAIIWRRTGGKIKVSLRARHKHRRFKDGKKISRWWS
jgi:hypothetical protein